MIQNLLGHPVVPPYWHEWYKKNDGNAIHAPWHFWNREFGKNHSSGNIEKVTYNSIFSLSLALFNYYSKACEECSDNYANFLSVFLSLSLSGNRIALSMCQVFLVTNDSNENLFLSHYYAVHNRAKEWFDVTYLCNSNESMSY